MKREWKPGDVAWLTVYGKSSFLGMRSAEMGGSWVTAAPVAGVHLHGSHDVSDARALVVVDPEDVYQVRRLRECFTEAGFPTETIQACLREFAEPTPPKPDEPTTASTPSACCPRESPMTDPRITEARAAADEGMDAATNAADIRIVLAVDQVIAEAIESGEAFSANTIRDRMPTVRSGLIGSRVKAASMRKEPRLVCVGTEPSTLKSTHAKEIARWRAAVAVEEAS